VDYTNTLRNRGMLREAALLAAGPPRLRPILMTASAAILGMLPLALGIGKGSEVQAPMATAVIGGLTKQEELSLRVGLPYLKDIPILGYLFSYNKKSIQNQDLVIFVTPTIVDEQLSGNQ